MFIVLIIATLLILVFIILTAIILGAEHEKDFMTNWEECNGNCSNCRDKEQCMNRPYN